MKSKLIVLTLILSLIFASACFASEILPGTVGLNSRPGETKLAQKSANEFFEMIRRMEGPGGLFGKNADIQAGTTNGSVTEVSAPNGLDVHMLKNTEWGGAIMLSASGYGIGTGKMASSSSSTTGGNANTSTTGNAYGVYGMNKYNGTAYSSGSSNYLFRQTEMVAGIWNRSNSYTSYLYYAKNRYVDRYTSVNGIPGDATVETNPLHSGAKHINSGYYLFYRDYFGYSTRTPYVSGGEPMISPYPVYSRFAVWVAPVSSGI